MRRFGIALALAASMAACSSGPDDDLHLIPPEFRVRQPAGQVGEGRMLLDPRDIDLLVDVWNRSSETIVLRRLTIQPVTGGAWRFDPASRSVRQEIPPGEVRTIDVWIRVVSDALGVDPTNPVSVRGTAVFDSDGGPFRRVFIEPIALGVEGGSTPR